MSLSRKNSNYSRSGSRGTAHSFQLATPRELTDKPAVPATPRATRASRSSSTAAAPTFAHSSTALGMPSDTGATLPADTETLPHEDADAAARVFRPSLENTRSLESEIAALIQQLSPSADTEGEGEGEASPSPKHPADTEIVAVLNKALMALSHWTLQGQLMQMSETQQRSLGSRSAVETSLARREVEFLKGQVSDLTRQRDAQTHVQTQVQTRARTPAARRSIDISPRTAVVQGLGDQRIIRFGRIRKPRSHGSSSAPAPAFSAQLPSTPVAVALAAPCALPTALPATPSAASATGSATGSGVSTPTASTLRLVERQRSPRRAQTGGSSPANERLRVFQLRK
ncbi:hypothetical protein DAKH74_020120 [Maudiozyma humilis]|uniref:Uncharacterized protein n=1 Tax=Maudiozyma humilis TaxID=51915 RepID=A0AAV5RVA6_MAUHU|nr:hypothetical protein DAKH74_020120 [Kazachstania humilis]